MRAFGLGPTRCAGPALRPTAAHCAAARRRRPGRQLGRRSVPGDRQARADAARTARGRAAEAGGPRDRPIDAVFASGADPELGRAGERARRDRPSGRRPAAPLRARSPRWTPWGWASSSSSTSRSCAGWPTTPARCSSCSMRGASSARSAAAGATTICSSAGRRRPAGARLRHGRRGAGRAAQGPRAGCRQRPDGWTSSCAVIRATTCRTCWAWRIELRDAGSPGGVRAGAPGAGQAAQAGRRAGRRLAVVIGPDDRARGEVMLKDLKAHQAACSETDGER